MVRRVDLPTVQYREAAAAPQRPRFSGSAPQYLPEVAAQDGGVPQAGFHSQPHVRGPFPPGWRPRLKMRNRLPLYEAVTYALGPTTFWMVIFGIILFALPDWAWRLKVAARAEAGLILVGLLGLWRYTWYMTHVVRGFMYSRQVFPAMRSTAMGQAKPYPQRAYFLIPSYFEEEGVTERVMLALVREVALLPGVQFKAVASVGSDEEEELMRRLVNQYIQSDNLDLVFLRQSEGKRIAMADALRAIGAERYKDRMAARQSGLPDDAYNDVVIFMDGDIEMGEETLVKTLPYFTAYPRLGAVTTDELGRVYAGGLVKTWFSLKFAKRHSIMKSHSLSRRVLTLTGRFSAFRAEAVLTEEFASHLEADTIQHWVYGKIRFLMGDDKSTFFVLLKNQWDMFYLPDTVVYSVETRRQSFLKQSFSLMFRWHGNTLRNSARSIALGPKRAGGFFIWLCLVDQRISMWTTLVAPIAMILLSFFISPWFAAFYAAWLLLVRLFQIWILVIQGHRMRLMDIPLQIWDQWVGSVVKVYALFNLGRQKWSKSKSQTAGSGNLSWGRKWIPLYLFFFYLLLLTIAVGLLTEVVRMPSFG